MTDDEESLRTLMVRAAPEFGPLDGALIRDVSDLALPAAHPARTRRIALATVAAAAVVAVAVVSTLIATHRRSGTSAPLGAQSHSNGFHVRLVLPGTTFPANGTPIHAYVIATNHTGKPIEPAGEDCSIWFAAGLSGGPVNLHFDLAIGSGACPRSRKTEIRKPVFRQSVTIETTYPECAEGQQPATPTSPHCLTSGPSAMPPLPPGHYTVQVQAIGGSPTPTLPAPIHITLTR